MERVPSGNPALDEILGGGLLRSSINLVAGLPGSGKTVLAQQYAFGNATDELPALYASTVSEPMEKILRYAATLEFFDRGAVGMCVFFDDLGDVLADGDVGPARERIEQLLGERTYGVLVIDSFRALARGTDPGTFTRFIHDLAGLLGGLPTTTFWLAEYGRDELEHAPEFAVADSALLLQREDAGALETRSLRVLKLRGSGHRSGSHAFRITEGGIEAFPRLADPTDAEGYDLGDAKASSGIPSLDLLLGDGYYPGSSTLVVGPSGVGKTVMALHFLVGGVDAGEPGVYAGLQEDPSQLQRTMRGFGWSLPMERFHLKVEARSDLYVDEWLADVLRLVERTGSRRLVVDSLGDLEVASADGKRFREFVSTLTARCSRMGVSLLLTYETPELFGIRRLSETGVSHLSDNVVLLQYVREGSRLKRAVTALKTRATSNLPETREFGIGKDGLSVGEPIVVD